MISKKRVWLVGVLIMLFACGSFAYATEELRDILQPGDRSGDSGAAIYTPTFSGRDSDPLPPPTPLHPLSASQTIYIYVQLRQPPWLPPPPIMNSEHSCSPALIQIKIDTLITGAEKYNVYRDTLPMFYNTHYDSTNNLIGSTASRYFDDYFTDPLWYDIGSKGVCDPAVNYFYIATALDSTAGGWTESQRPSPCSGEFDFRLYEGWNWISYALDINVRDGAVFASRIPGATRLETWDNESQFWSIVARWTIFPPPAHWVSEDSVDVLYPYRVYIPTLEDTIFTMAIPGRVPVEDPHFTLKRGNNLISLPYRQQRLSLITTGEDLGEDIGNPPADRITTWDAENQMLRIVARWILFPPPAHWVNGSGEWARVRPGYPYMVHCTADREEPWPPIAR